MKSKVKLSVSGMHCVSCSINIDGELEDTDGVISSNTSYAKQVAEVEFDSKKISPKKIIEIVRKVGYDVQLVNS